MQGCTYMCGCLSTHSHVLLALYSECVQHCGRLCAGVGAQGLACLMSCFECWYVLVLWCSVMLWCLHGHFQSSHSVSQHEGVMVWQYLTTRHQDSLCHVPRAGCGGSRRLSLCKAVALCEHVWAEACW